MKGYLFSKIKKFKYIIAYKVLYNIILALISIALILISKDILSSALEKDSNGLRTSIIIFVVLTLISLIFTPIHSYISAILKCKIVDSMQEELYQKAINSKFQKLYQYSSIDIINRINIDCLSIISFIYEILPKIIGLLVLIISSIIILININYIFVVILLSLAILSAIFSKGLNKKQKSLYKNMQNNEVEHRLHMDESLKNIEYIKVSELEERNFASISEIHKERLELSKKMSIIVGAISFLFSMGSSISYTLIFIIGIFQLYKGHLGIPEFTMLLQVYRQINSQIYELQSYIPTFTNVIAAIERINEIEILESEELKNDRNIDFTDGIEFKNIAFNYGDLKIVDDLSFKVSKGDIIGIIGESGIGKSTLLRILSSLLPLNSGDILIDGKQLTNSHRNLISYVPQDDMLFSKSIKENILYHNDNISESELSETLNISKIDGFIDKLPKGIDTNVKYLSKGQRQRVALARAIIQRKPIILLDEVTAALDINTEEHIINSIKNLDYKPTCIIVTHRKSILNICNKTFNMKNILNKV